MLPASIPEIPLILSPQTKAAKSFVGFKASLENHTKLGGKPDWIQDPEEPFCEHCGEKMTFYGQLDSIGDKACLCDAGMIYVFVCPSCQWRTKSVFQTY